MRSRTFAMALWALPALLAALGAPARAADEVVVRATMSPDVVAVGGEAVLTVQVEGKFRRTGNPELPPLDDFDVYESGSSQNFSFVNGQVTSSITFTYVLAPRREGVFRIEPIRFTIGDKEYTANPVTLEVTAGSSGVVPPPVERSDRPPRELPDEDESIFVTASVDRDTVYVNEQVTWTLGYYTDGRVALLRNPNYSPPAAEGFWAEDLPPQGKYQTTLHGRQYLVNEIKRALFPASPGVYTIGEARVDIVIDDFVRRNAFDNFFRGGLRSGEARRLVTKPLQVVVLPLPEKSKPADFSGVVAKDLTVSMAADKQVVQVGEPVNVAVEVSGVGNMRTIAPPKLADLDPYKVYESGSSFDSFKRDWAVAGRRRYEFVVVPQVEGKHTIPAVKLYYFDPQRAGYFVAESSPLVLDVNPGSKEDGRPVFRAGGDDFEVLNRDIRFIHAVPPSLAVASAPFYTSRAYLVMHALPALALAASVVAERRRRRLREDVRYARESRALREALHRLAKAEKGVRDGDLEGAYAAVHHAVFHYFADKMNASAAGLTGDTIEAYLRSRGADDALAGSALEVLAACDAARYSPAARGVPQASAIAKAAREAIVAAEKLRR